MFLPLSLPTYIQEFTESVLELKPQISEVQAAGKRLKEACSAKV